MQAETLERAIRVLGEGATGSTLIAAGPNLFKKGQTARSEVCAIASVVLVAECGGSTDDNEVCEQDR